jgi:hypothetical protein
MVTTNMAYLGKLERIDPRIIYVLLLLCVFVPLVAPMGLPIPYSKETMDFYRVVDGLAPGSVVVISFDYSAAGAPELTPAAVAIIRHLNQKDARIITIGFWGDGPMFADMALKEVFGGTRDHPEYGRKFVNLGYIAGLETGAAAFASDVHKTVPADFYGNAVTKLELMKDVKTAKDIKLFIDLVAGTPGLVEILRQIQGPYGVTTLCAALSLWLPSVIPYYPGQVPGLLSGARGAAEYELLVKKPGPAVKSMDAQSLTHLLIVVFVVIGNVGYIAKLRKAKEGDEK